MSYLFRCIYIKELNEWSACKTCSFKSLYVNNIFKNGKTIIVDFFISFYFLRNCGLFNVDVFY